MSTYGHGDKELHSRVQVPVFRWSRLVGHRSRHAFAASCQADAISPETPDHCSNIETNKSIAAKRAYIIPI
jgi:hypothetical protein